MSAPSSFDEVYWPEVVAAIRALVVPGVVVAAAFGAVLTLAGASAHLLMPAHAVGPSCPMRALAPHPPHPDVP